MGYLPITYLPITYLSFSLPPPRLRRIGYAPKGVPEEE